MYLPHYLLAAFLVAGSLLLRRLLDPWLGQSVPFLQFFPAIMIASWYGGRGPGLFATALAAPAAAYFFLPPPGSLAVASGGQLWSLIAAGNSGR